jgi:hypothetical protein
MVINGLGGMVSILYNYLSFLSNERCAMVWSKLQGLSSLSSLALRVHIVVPFADDEC